MGFFPTAPQNSFHAPMPPTPHSVDHTNVPGLQVTDDRMVEILLRMENVLNISNLGQALSESLRTDNVNRLAGESRPILQPQFKVPYLTKQQCDQAMVVVLEDIWNLACWGYRDPSHSLFTCPYLTTVQLIFFSYCYFCHHMQAI